MSSSSMTNKPDETNKKDAYQIRTEQEETKPRPSCDDFDFSPIPGLTGEQYQLLNLLTCSEKGTKPDSWPIANMASTFPVAHTTSSIKRRSNWIVDSGATDHITCKASILENHTKSTHELPVIIPNGERIDVEGRGDYTLESGSKIKGVLHVPKFNCNLLSVSKLSKDLQCAVTFFPDFFVMQDLHSGKLVGAGRCKDGLYQMGMVEDERRAMMTTIDIWHKRLGHASNSKLSHIEFLKDVSTKNKDWFCDSCAKAKHTRLPFPVGSIKTHSCFELMHCDIWGPYRTPSTSRASYFLTVVDDYSRAVWVFLIKHKNDARECLIEFHKWVKTQFEKNIKRFRCDNGGEFTSNRMLKFYADQGIVLETTCPHTPQQNGVVERKHRHLLEVARALRFEANLPTKFWGECILTATYLINRLPSEVIENKTPYEILYNQKPDYDLLRVFGCLAYYRSTETKGDKFEPRGRPGVFVGYPRGTKGYKIYDIEHGKIMISRDVKFMENIFPFSKINESKYQEDVFMSPNTWEEKNKYFEGMEMISESHDVSNNPRREDGGPIQESSSTTQNEKNDNGSGPSHETSSSAQENEVEEEIGNVQSMDEENLGQKENTNETTEPIELIRGRRSKTQPRHLSDYEVKLPPSVDHARPATNQEPSTVHPLANFISYEKFSNCHKAYLTAIDSNDEPKHFSEAVQDERWREAMRKEIQALEENDTWRLEELPKGKHAIDSKWVYKIKYKPNGEIERYKARLVAKGFTQMEGVDYHETFAPVAKLVTVRSLLAVAVKKDWIIHQLDVNNAFLHGELDEEVYMKIPQGFCKKEETRVCKLKKSLYGLKQASRNWYQKFTLALIEIGFRQTKMDHSLFVYKNGDTCITALIYVDDVIVAGNSLEKIQQTKDFLDKRFSIKDLGVLKYFLGIEVARTRKGLVLSQRKYILDILDDCGLLGCRPSSFPMEQSLKLDKDSGGPKVDASQYRRLVGRLLYLQATRPDIAYSVNVLSQFVGDPRQTHMEAATRVLRYLKATPGQGILLPRDGGTNLVAYCDSDWLGCPFTRKSRTGYLLLLGGAPISWRSKKQSVVSRSSAEAEYRAMATTVSEVLWMRWLLKELDVTQIGPTPLFCDNQAARHIANNPVFHERTKHVEMDCYFVRERVESHEIQPMNIHTKSQIADLFTKSLGAQQFRTLRDKLGVQNLHAPT
ncbi:hypothetical protein SSX86_027575 [Deinandra increscens subsp. villosa]|uniref:Integrase catalytic domain-containing protein n=1 Tax=Deinandra increscens subsp. villosa TaxID=3103831 RepID=A0AAP0C722_9ASTR